MITARRLEVQGERVGFGEVHELDDVDGARARRLELVEYVIVDSSNAAARPIPIP